MEGLDELVRLCTNKWLSLVVRDLRTDSIFPEIINAEYGAMCGFPRPELLKIWWGWYWRTRL